MEIPAGALVVAFIFSHSRVPVLFVCWVDAGSGMPTRSAQLFGWRKLRNALRNSIYCFVTMPSLPNARPHTPLSCRESTDSVSVTCTAPVNIAVVKYWGKRDEKLILPVNSSLSGTLHQVQYRSAARRYFLQLSVLFLFFHRI